MVLENQVFLLLLRCGEFPALFSKLREKCCLAGNEGKNKSLLFVCAVRYLGSCQSCSLKQKGAFQQYAIFTGPCGSVVSHNEPHQCKTYDAFVTPNKDTNPPKQSSTAKRICKAGFAGGSSTGCPQALRAAAGLWLAGMWLLCLAGPAEALAIELVAVVVSPDWQQLSDVCDRHFPDGKIMKLNCREGQIFLISQR